jgi:sigma-E factor negative regulatory protein RseB
MMNKKSILLWLFISAVAWSLPAFAKQSAPEWIRKMSQAMQELTYEGVFVYLHGNEVETMKVVHDFDAMGERERLSSLNGEARVIIRDAENVTCIWPGSKSVIVTKSKPRTPFPKFEAASMPAFTQHYNFISLGADRVAGHESQIVAMMPKDQFRYGYKLWIHKKSHLLLRSMLLDMNEKIIEQVMFTSIHFPKTTDDKLFETDPKGPGYSWKTANADMPKMLNKVDSFINFSDLPAGYKKISESMRPQPIDKNLIRHAIVSDGVASVSVYVEYTNGEEADEHEGMTSMGAIHAYGRNMKGAFVTVVGEVPFQAVKFIGDAVLLDN